MKQNYYPITMTIIAVAAMVFSVSSGVYLHHVRAMSQQDLFEYLDLFYKVYNDVNDFYIDELRPEILEEGAIRGLLLAANPYNDYIIPENHTKSILASIDSGFSGVSIGYKDRIWTVMSIVPDSAAHKNGLQLGDKLYQVDDQELHNLYLSEIYEHLTGRSSEKRLLKLIRGTPMKQIEVEIQLEPVQPLEPVTSRVLDGGIGYIRIASFAEENLPDQISRILEKMTRDSVQGMILDLRNNSSGYIDRGFSVCDLFIEDGKSLGFCRKNEQSQEQHYYSRDNHFYNLNPLVVLVDEGSASAAETLAGAFKDLKRGLLLGEKTFGKAVKQESYDLENAILRLVTGYYHTPNGDRIYLNGIDPQIVLESEPYFLSHEDLEKDACVIRAKELIAAHDVFSKQVNAP